MSLLFVIVSTGKTDLKYCTIRVIISDSPLLDSSADLLASRLANFTPLIGLHVVAIFNIVRDLPTQVITFESSMTN